MSKNPIAVAIHGLRSEVVWVGLFSFVANLLALTPALYSLQIMDRVMVYRNEFTLLTITAIVLLLYAVASTSEWLRSRLMIRMSVRLDELLNVGVFRGIFDAYLKRPDSRSVTAMNDLTQLRQFLAGQGLFAMFDAPWTPLYIAILYVMHPILGYSAIGLALLSTLIAILGQRQSAQLARAIQDSQDEHATYLQSKLKNIEIVESLGMGRGIYQQWDFRYRKFLDANKAMQAKMRVFHGISRYLGQLQGSLILAVAALLMIERELSLGAMAAATMIMGQATRPFGMLAGSWSQFLQARLAFRKLSELMEHSPDYEGRHRAEAIDGRISVRRLSAFAKDRDVAVLDQLSFDVSPGECLAIIGSSGAGKSTLARVLLGIWPDIRGHVAIDGVEATQWDRDSLGRFMGYVPQHVQLFDASVAENICRMGEPDSEAVVDAARRAAAHDLILRLPQGYETRLTDQGVSLSGGQRQRIGLARALYGRPRIVVMDEPNTHLDDQGLAALVAILRRLKEEGCTVLLIVHQEALLAYADRVLKLDQGRIVYDGEAKVYRAEGVAQ